MDLTKRILDILDQLEDGVKKLKNLNDAGDRKKTVVIERADNILTKSYDMLERVYLKVKDEKELIAVLDYVEKRSNELVDQVVAKYGTKEDKLQKADATFVSVKKEAVNPLKEWLMEDKE